VLQYEVEVVYGGEFVHESGEGSGVGSVAVGDSGEGYFND
jgi:hypothetical protein